MSLYSTFSAAGDPNRKSYPGQTLAAAVAAKARLLPRQKRDLEFVLAWDMPVVEFGSGKGVKYCRYCTTKLPLLAIFSNLVIIGGLAYRKALEREGRERLRKRQLRSSLLIFVSKKKGRKCLEAGSGLSIPKFTSS